MSQELQVGSSFRLTTRGLSPKQGLSSLQEVFDRKVQLNFEAKPGQMIDAELSVQGLPGLRRASMVSTADVRLRRQAAMLADGEDDVCLIINTGGGLCIEQRRQQTVARPGDGVLLVYREAAVLDFVAMNYVAIRVPFKALAPMSPNIESKAAHLVRRETAALGLLQTYLATLPTKPLDPQLGRLVTSHVYDLMALAIGVTPEGRAQAAARGLRAGRLQAIKADLLRNTELTLQQVAQRQGVSPRFVQMLFEEEGTTFSGFVLDRRLNAARAMLGSPRFADWSITAVALEAGFGDLSYFNRRFKERYQMTPSDARAKAPYRA